MCAHPTSPDAQRERILDVCTQVTAELGCGESSLELTLASAGISLKEFHEHFYSLDDCILAVLERAKKRSGGIIAHAYSNAESRRDAVSAALAAVLELLDQDRPFAKLLVVQAPRACPTVAVRRAQLIGELASILYRDTPKSAADGTPRTSLMADALVGAISVVIHAQLLQSGPPAKLIDLHDDLMSTVVDPYLKSRS